MEPALCVLCLKGVNVKGSSSTPWRQDIIGLCQLLTPQLDPLDDDIANVEDESCDLCSFCWDLIYEMKMIQEQIAQLQVQTAKRIVLVRNRILDSVPKFKQHQTLDEGEMQRLRSIRDILVRLSVQDNNLDLGELDVKIEPEDELFEGPISLSTFHSEEIKNELFCEEDDEETDSSFCITPQRPNLRSLRSTKRKADDEESESEKDTPTKKKKRSTISEKDVKLNLVIKTSPPTSEGELEDGSSESDFEESSKKRKRKSKEIPVPCGICLEKFQNQTHLRAHHEKEHESLPFLSDEGFTCDKCGKVFAVKANFKKHLKFHEVNSDTKLHVCDICSFVCTNAKALSSHQRKHLGEKLLKCKHCDEKFTDYSTRNSHYEVHSSPGIIHCPVCDTKLSTADHLKLHMQQHEVNLLREVTCELCKESFSFKGALQSHMIGKHGIYPFNCDECGAKFKEKSALDYHKMRRHTEKLRECDVNPSIKLQNIFFKICNARFVPKGKLNQHQPAKTVQCAQCEKCFKNNKNLKKHAQSIHKTKKHTHGCSYPACGKKFLYPYLLEGHVRQVHTLERPFVCEVCKKDFAVQNSFNTHKKAAHGIEVVSLYGLGGKRLPRSKQQLSSTSKETTG